MYCLSWGMVPKCFSIPLSAKRFLNFLMWNLNYLNARDVIYKLNDGWSKLNMMYYGKIALESIRRSTHRSNCLAMAHVGTTCGTFGRVIAAVISQYVMGLGLMDRSIVYLIDSCVTSPITFVVQWFIFYSFVWSWQLSDLAFYVMTWYWLL